MIIRFVLVVSIFVLVDLICELCIMDSINGHSNNRPNGHCYMHQLNLYMCNEIVAPAEQWTSFKFQTQTWQLTPSDKLHAKNLLINGWWV